MKKVFLLLFTTQILNSCIIEDPEPVSDIGSVVFWMSEGNTDVYIYVNGKLEGQITANRSTVPECGKQGFVTVTLRDGAYKFEAVEDSAFPSKWNGVINVRGGECNGLKLTYN